MDVAFIIDKTSSLGVPNFLLLRGFLLELVAALNIGPDATHTGIITFNRKPKVLSDFSNSGLYSNEAVHDFLAKISVVLGDRTFTDKALMAAAGKLFTEEGGDRPDFPNVLIILTDGRTNPASKPFSTIIPLLEVRIPRYYNLLLFVHLFLSAPFIFLETRMSYAKEFYATSDSTRSENNWENVIFV